MILSCNPVKFQTLCMTVSDMGKSSLLYTDLDASNSSDPGPPDPEDRVPWKAARHVIRVAKWDDCYFVHKFQFLCDQN